MEVRRSLVGRPVFKTGGGDEKFPRQVRFLCASASICCMCLANSTSRFILMADISLTSGMSGNLFALKSTARNIDRTQERLTTGRKVNSALDNPTSFFASQAHMNRAGDLMSRKDSVEEAVQVIVAANSGITAISTLLQSAYSLTDSALATTSPANHAFLAAQFDEMLAQIDTLTADSSYRGTNLLKNQDLTLNFAETSGQSTLTIAGVDTTSSGLGVVRANPVTDTSGIINVASGIQPITKSFTSNDAYYYPSPLFPTFPVADMAAAVADPAHYRFVDAATGNNTGRIVLDPPTLSVYGGVVLQGSFTQGEAITLQYSPLGFNQLGTIANGNSWATTGDIQNSQDQITAAIATMRSHAASLASNSDILTTRLDFTSSLAGILQTGADNLTLADMNEEGANMLLLQTQQSLGVTGLSMGAKSAQTVMKLF